MQMQTHSQSASFAFSTILILLVSWVAAVSTFKRAETFIEPSTASGSVNPQECPAGTTFIAGTEQCEVSQTLEPKSNETIDCHDLTLVPTINLKTHQRRGIGTAWPDGRSKPEVAIFIHDTTNVTIQHCRIQDFDFGIFAIKGNTPNGRHHILNNRINVRYAAITLMGVDSTEIKDNELTFTAMGGKGISVQRDSNKNVIQRNHIFVNIDINETASYRAPGPQSPSNPKLPPASAAGQPPVTSPAIFVGQLQGVEPTLLTIFINSSEPSLYQLETSRSPLPNFEFTAGNIIEKNVITFTNSQLSYDGIALGVTQCASDQCTLVIGNTINSNAVAAIKVGSQPVIPNIDFPGTCRANNTRKCLGDDDCHMTFDIKDLGPCDGKTQLHSFSWMGNGNIVENNIINGPFTFGIALAGKTTTITNNRITGPVRQGPAGGGIALFANSLEDSVITMNTVSGATPALVLIQSFQQAKASSFGTEVSQNNFTDYNSVAVGVAFTLPPTTNRYNLPSELSVNKRGNYWGIACCMFRHSNIAFDPGKVLNLEDKMKNNAVLDSFPFGRPLSKTSSREEESIRLPVLLPCRRLPPCGQPPPPRRGRAHKLK